MYINTILNIYNKYTWLYSLHVVVSKKQTVLEYVLLTLMKLIRGIKLSFGLLYFLYKPNTHWQVSKSFISPPRLSVFPPAFLHSFCSFSSLFGCPRAAGMEEALTGSRTRPRSCPRGAAAAFLHSRSTACLRGSFWWERSRASPLCPGGNASAGSGNSRRKTRLHGRLQARKLYSCRCSFFISQTSQHFILNNWSVSCRFAVLIGSTTHC